MGGFGPSCLLAADMGFEGGIAASRRLNVSKGAGPGGDMRLLMSNGRLGLEEVEVDDIGIIV